MGARGRRHLRTAAAALSVAAAAALAAGFGAALDLDTVNRFLLIVALDCAVLILGYAVGFLHGRQARIDDGW